MRALAGRGALLFAILVPVAAPAAQEDRPDSAARSATCVQAADGERLGGLEGVVRDAATNLALPGARVLLRVPDGESDGEALRRRELRTDALGRYRACRLPPGRTVSLSATANERTGPDRDVWIERDAVRSVDLPVPLGRPGRLTGRVLSGVTSRGVENVEVAVPAFSVETLTDSQGRFLLPPLPPGEYTLELNHLAYGHRADSIAVISGRTLDLRIPLAMRPIPVAPLRVEVEEVRSVWLEATGFYERRNRGHGAFLTREEIEAQDPARLSEVFRRLPGIRARGGDLQMQRAPRSLLSGQQCEIQYFLNGQAAALPTGVDALAPADIMAIEVYQGPSEVPTEFNVKRAACGVVVLWMRVERP